MFDVSLSPAGPWPVWARPRPLLLTNGKSQEVGVHLGGGRRLSILRNPLFLDISRERHPSDGALPLAVDEEGEATRLIRQ